MQLTLSISPCPNDTFMFDALINRRIDSGGLSFAATYLDIEELNARAQMGVADVTKVSCALLPRIAAEYELLDSGAALGRGNGPLLVRRAGENKPLRSVAVPGMDTTANTLMDLLFPQITNKTPVLFSRIAEAVAEGLFDAGVLIHEGRFVYQKSHLALVADLGLLWEQRTGLPLPLGAIVVRRSLPSEVKQQVGELLRSSIEYAFAHPQSSREYIKAHARELDDTVIDSHIGLFVNEHSLALGDDGYHALTALTGCDFRTMTL